MRKNLLFISLFLLTVCEGFSQNAKPVVSFVNPKGLAKPAGYSTTAEIDLGKYFG